MEERISKAIIDGGGSGYKASIIESTTDPTKKGLVILNPDGSSVGGGGSGNDKGYFITEAALNTAYPVGEAGWYAVVGDTDSIWIRDADTNAWVDSGVSDYVESVVAGDGISVDNTDPANPIVSNTGVITEIDPVFTSSEAANITATDITNLSNLSGINTGDQDLSGYVPTTRTLTINGTGYDLSANRSWTVTAAPNPNTKRMLIQNM